MNGYIVTCSDLNLNKFVAKSYCPLAWWSEYKHINVRFVLISSFDQSLIILQESGLSGCFRDQSGYPEFGFSAASSSSKLRLPPAAAAMVSYSQQNQQLEQALHARRKLINCIDLLIYSFPYSFPFFFSWPEPWKCTCIYTYDHEYWSTSIVNYFHWCWLTRDGYIY